jgi:hypothetical protein
MDKKDALLVQILAQASTRDLAKNRMTAPQNLYDSVKEQFRLAEETLKDTKVTVSNRGGRGTQKVVTWHPGMGLRIHDAGPTGFPHWTEVPEGVMLVAVSLLPGLLDQAHKIRTKNKSKDLEVGAKAILEGLDLPLMPAAPSATRALSKEEDAPPVPHAVIDEDDDDIYEDEEEEEEDAPEESPEEEEDSDSMEILGVPHMPEVLEESDVDLEALLPPAAVVVEPPAKRGRKKKN